MAEGGPGGKGKSATLDEMPASLLGVTALDAFKLLDIDANALKNWRHFGEALLGLNARELKEFEGEKPSMAIYEKWISKNPDGCVNELITVLEEIERDDIVKGLREAILKSKAFKKYVQGNPPKAPTEYDRSNSCPSNQPTHKMAALCTTMKQQSLDESSLAANRMHTSEHRVLVTEESPNRHDSSERVGLPYSTTAPTMPTMESLSSGCVYAQEQVQSPVHHSHPGLYASQPHVISLQDVYSAFSHLLPSQQCQLGVSLKVFDARTGALVTTSAPPPGNCVLRDITFSPEPRPAPNPRVTVGTAIHLHITASQPCYLYIINIGTSGKETLLLPNSSMQTVRITGVTGSHVIRNMTIVGPTGQEVIKVLATSEDLASSNNVPVMRDIMMDPSTSWSSMLWGTAEVTLAVVIP